MKTNTKKPKSVGKPNARTPKTKTRSDWHSTQRAMSRPSAWKPASAVTTPAFKRGSCPWTKAALMAEATTECLSRLGPVESSLSA